MTKHNNFDFLRLLFATFVIITHSYSLSGIQECDWLCQLSNGHYLLSYIGVRGFFVISGFLVFQSLERSRSYVDYFWKRLLRLYPALFVVLLLTVLLAPFVYHNEGVSYLRNKAVWTYIPNNLSLYYVQYTIPGVFNHNPYGPFINGSLWTISFEFTCYAVLSLMFFIRNMKTLIRVLMCVIFCILFILNIFYGQELDKLHFFINPKLLAELGIYFAGGSLLAAFKYDNSHRHFPFLAFFLFLFIASIAADRFYWIKFISLPVIVLSFGLMATPAISILGKKVGDMSYGMYIYGFPVQQTLIYFFAPGYFALMLTAIPIAFVLAYVSWHWIEKPAFKLKKLSPLMIVRTAINGIRT